ncbi:hypothetical protein K7X08_035885 [Anisodus acutangulus]|uniref:Non-haem dioxygenase N-terminal domain-containing protein n=1 Tax=Anisodus acutangulus TaxID=402998 RepID=A0A9Q1L7H4_9SOLA|nr:hypothetical protein K7X08_035885 [Anisodus acutangulus]
MAPALSTISNSNTWGFINFVVNEGHRVKGLADMGIQTLPKQYIQPPEERITSSGVVAEEQSIPVIDLSNWNDPKVGKMICNAADKWGFFQIVNHVIPMEVFKNVKDATHRFFGLPAEEKREYSKKYSCTNNVHFGTSFSPQAEKDLEWKDYLNLFYVSDEEATAFWPLACRSVLIFKLDELCDYLI